MLQWFHDLSTWMVGLAETSTGSWSLFGLAFAESSFFPIPPDVLLLALDLVRPQDSFVFAAICTAGSTFGGMVGYAIGRWGGRPLLERVLKPARLQAIERMFQRYDVWAVGIAGFTPIPYKVFTIAAGAFRLRFGRFVLVSAVSRGARFFLVSTVVFLFREEAQRLVQEYLEVATLGFIVLLIGGFLAVRWLVRDQGSANQSTS